MKDLCQSDQPQSGSEQPVSFTQYQHVRHFHVQALLMHDNIC